MFILFSFYYLGFLLILEYHASLVKIWRNEGIGKYDVLLKFYSFSFPLAFVCITIKTTVSCRDLCSSEKFFVISQDSLKYYQKMLGRLSKE